MKEEKINSWLGFLKNQYYKNPKKIAFVNGSEKITYGYFAKLVYKYHQYFESLKLTQATNVIVVSKRDYRFFAAFGGCILSKCIFVPLEENIPQSKIDYYKSKLDNYYLFDNYLDIPFDENEYDLDSVINSLELSPKDVGQILFTSGSTGEPKGVVSTNIFLTSLSGPKEGVTSDISLLICTPVNHAGGMYMTLTILKNGGTVQYLDNAFDFNGFFNAFENNGANALFATPSIIKTYLELGEEDLANLHLKLCVVTGERCDVELKNKFKKATGIPLVSFYGSTECNLMAVNIDEQQEGCIGYPFGDKRIEIIDEEIVIYSDYMFKNYVGETSHQQPFHTGDLGRIEGGKIYIEGRKDHTINSGGLKINPEEVIKVAEKNKGVKEALLVGKNDKEFQKIAVLYYVGDISEKELLQFLRDNLEPYKVPKEIYKIEKIAKTYSGKKDIKYYESLVNSKN